ncbi:hypothetical protein DOY81_015486, partial [Sarcophaga bullata]
EKALANERFAHYWPDAEAEIVEEGAEPDDFWEYLNGEGIYDHSISEKGAPILEPRLFHCRLLGNRIKVEQVNHFEQGDLDMDDVMLMDAGDEIYYCEVRLWLQLMRMVEFWIWPRNTSNLNPLNVQLTLSVLYAFLKITNHAYLNACSLYGKKVIGR